MRKDPEYGRTTITVPRELKRKMKQARGYVNWSAVACEAFEAKLEEIVPMEEISSIDQAIERMKTLGQSNEGKSSNQGKSGGLEAGKKWAMNQATPAQLANIQELKEEMSAAQWKRRLKKPEGIRELTECISSEMDLDFGPRRSRHHRRRPRNEVRMGGPGRGRMIWRSILDSRPDHPNFFFDFAEGALEVWKQIKDKL